MTMAALAGDIGRLGKEVLGKDDDAAVCAVEQMLDLEWLGIQRVTDYATIYKGRSMMRERGGYTRQERLDDDRWTSS